MTETIVYSAPRNSMASYGMRRSGETAMRGGQTDCAVEMRFTLKYTGKKEGTDCYEYCVSDHSQTNHEGLYKWVEDLKGLTEYLEFGVSEGRMQRIFNLREIYRKWERRLWYETRKRHRHDANRDELLEAVEHIICEESRFVETLCYAPPFSLLFSGLRGLAFEDGTSVGRESRIADFGGCPYLPIVLDDRLEVKSDGYEVFSEGKVNAALFDEKIFANFVRTLMDDSIAIDELNTRHTERYAFDGMGCVSQAMLLHLSVVPDFMFREERVFIKRF